MYLITVIKPTHPNIKVISEITCQHEQINDETKRMLKFNIMPCFIP